MNRAREGQIVLLLSADGRHYLVQLQAKQAFHTDLGLIHHDDLIGQTFGREVPTQTGNVFVLLEPSTHDLLMGIKRATQIIYPKDVGYLLLKLNVQPGSRVLEVGTGSGALTLSLARAVGEEGRVFSYDIRADLQDLARRNLERVGLEARVELKRGDAAEGFAETGLDAGFMDVREPWRYLEQVQKALQPGGFLGALVPTTNQVQELVAALQEQAVRDVEVCELMLRQYKPVPERLRPMDRLTAHTGYLIFGRTRPHEAR